MKSKWIWIGVLAVIILIIGGKWYMDRETDKQELITIQDDLANYLYKNYRIYKKDNNEAKKIKEKYNNGNGTLTEDEYINQIKNVRVYSDINKIEFTDFTVTPMNTVRVHFTINNGVFKDDVDLDTISAETNKLIYNIGEFNGSGPYYLEKKKKNTTSPIPKNDIIYYEGGIN